MKIAILASNPKLYSNKRLIAAGEERGHTMRFVNIRECYMNITAAKPSIHYKGGELLTGVDAVIPRIRPSMTFYGTAVVRQFEMMNTYCQNNSMGIVRSRDKLRTMQLFSKNADIDIPITGFANSPVNTKDLIRMVGGAPLVIKLLEGTQGVGVVLAETSKAAESVINAFKSINANILVQEFIKESVGTDIRCFVIGDKVVAAMQRTAPEGEFRANVHMGATTSIVKITPTERAMAVKATKVVGLKVAGVDLIRSKSGPKLLEINSSPGLEGIEGASKKDIAGLMIQHIEKQVKSKAKEKAKEKDQPKSV